MSFSFGFGAGSSRSGGPLHPSTNGAGPIRQFRVKTFYRTRGAVSGRGGAGRSGQALRASPPEPRDVTRREKMMVPRAARLPLRLAAVITFLALVGRDGNDPHRAGRRRRLGRTPGGHEVQEDQLARVARRLRHPDLRQRQDQEQEAQEARRPPPAEAAFGLAEGRQGQDQRQGPVPPEGEDELVPQEDQDARGRASPPARRPATRPRGAASPSTRPTRPPAAPAPGRGSHLATRSSSTRALPCAGGSTPSTRPPASSPR